MAITLNALVLPDLAWDDEFAWAPVTQVQTRCESGVLILEEAELVAGRPITLKGGADYGWAPRSLVLALHALQQTAAASPMTLTLNDARTFAVVWRRDGSPSAIDAAPVVGPLADPEAGDLYTLTLRLMTV